MLSSPKTKVKAIASRLTTSRVPQLSLMAVKILLNVSIFAKMYKSTKEYSLTSIQQAVKERLNSNVACKDVFYYR
jgi:hypothetical protein